MKNAAPRPGHVFPLTSPVRPHHQIGQDLYLLSVEELAERIALMSSEIERLKEAMGKKRATKDAAASFFKK